MIRKQLLLSRLAAVCCGLLAAGCSMQNRPDSDVLGVHKITSENIGDLHLVEGGSFQTYKRIKQDVKGPVITIKTPFYIGKYEITCEQYARVMGTEPVPEVQRNLPKGGLKWHEAIVFCNKLSEKEGLTPAYEPDYDITDPVDVSPNWKLVKNANGYRLPTCAQWLWAAMGGVRGSKPNKNGIYDKGWHKPFSGARYYNPLIEEDPNTIDDYVWYEDNSSKKLKPVGQKKPNELGLYDMSGNALEWGGDYGYIGSDRYLDDADDPFTKGNFGNASTRTLMGGSSLNPAYLQVIAIDNPFSRNNDSFVNGLRVVRPK
ncbi:MAG: formylglycine-generating enzyme family protein [Treponema sp.]